MSQLIPFEKRVVGQEHIETVDGRDLHRFLMEVSVMPERKAPQNAAEILKALHEFIIDTEKDVSAMSWKRVQAELKADGIDAAPLIRRVRDRLATMPAAEELARARSQRQQLLELRERMTNP